MLEIINKAREKFKALSPRDKETYEKIKKEYLSKDGEIKNLFNIFTALDVDTKKLVGKELNNLKIFISQKIEEWGKNFEQQISTSNIIPTIDLTLPNHVEVGKIHPVSNIIYDVADILNKMGFEFVDGPEIEDEWHNFEALNLDADHPARDEQDTIYLKYSGLAMRSQTSSTQIRVMESQTPPIRITHCGKSFRNETISARSHCYFNQMEALYVDKGVSFADLKTTLSLFIKELFGSDTKIRLRTSFFPFTEPSAELDISCTICSGAGCTICKKSGWLELGGCGMVDPNVLEKCKIDSKVYTGFAWGFGIERMAMLIYQINDIRLFSENDIRFLNQF